MVLLVLRRLKDELSYFVASICTGNAKMKHLHDHNEPSMLKPLQAAIPAVSFCLESSSLQASHPSLA